MSERESGKIITAIWQTNGKAWRYGATPLPTSFSMSLQLTTEVGLCFLTLALSLDGVSGAIILRGENCCNSRFKLVKKTYRCYKCGRDSYVTDMARIYGTPAIFAPSPMQAPTRQRDAAGYDELLTWFEKEDGIEAYWHREVFLREIDDIVLKVDRQLEQNPDWWKELHPSTVIYK